ncbi:hypothetical protein PINS_up007477 [Pythium insidiosum]|nr:hypothetical protein PINS_up007477 [Pythium insidiosum]
MDDDQFLDQLLKKSVILQATERRDSAADAVSVMQTTCHRLRFRSSRKRRSASTETPFQPIERVKLAGRRRGRADSDATTSTQLPRLVRSLEERLRVGQQQLTRLELLARDKSQSLRALSSLLQALDSGRDAPTGNRLVEEELVSLVSVLKLHETPPHAETDVVMTATQASTQATDALPLEMASCEIVAADLETSTFRCVVQLTPSLPVDPQALQGLALSLVPTESALVPSRCRSWLVDASTDHSRVLNVVVDLELSGWTLRSTADLCGWIHKSHSVDPPQHVGTIRVAPPRALWELPSLGASLTGAPGPSTDGVHTICLY